MKQNHKFDNIKNHLNVSIMYGIPALWRSALQSETRVKVHFSQLNF